MRGTEPTWREVSRIIEASPGSIESALPERIRRLRENYRTPGGEPLPLTHTDLARLLKGAGWTTDRTTLWKIENPTAGNGRRKISIDELVAFARALNVTVAELLLPEGSIEQIEARNAVADALEALDRANKAWANYSRAVRIAQLALADAVDEPQLRAQLTSWGEQLAGEETTHMVKLWRLAVTREIERGERPESGDLILADDETIVASESFRRFRALVSEQPVYPAYDDILSGATIAEDALLPGRDRTITARA